MDYYSDLRTSFLESRTRSGLQGDLDRGNFLIGLETELWARLARNNDSFIEAAQIDDDLLRANATFLHENAHWWQHMGSTCGFVVGQSMLLQTDSTLRFLAETRLTRLVKPLYHYDRDDPQIGQRAPLNGLVNTWMDVEFGQFLLFAPAEIAKRLRSRFFLSPAHALYTLYAEFNHLFAEVTGAGGEELFPNLDVWSDGLAVLAQKGAINHGPDAKVALPEIGLEAIGEAQARLFELRYLARATGERPWRTYAEKGLLGDRYTLALRAFLRDAGLAWPSGPLAPEVSLFLLAADIALNPASGYPQRETDLERFVWEVHPGTRLLLLARRVAAGVCPPKTVAAEDRSAYGAACAALAAPLGWPSPKELATHITLTASRSPRLETLRQVGASCDFDNETVVPDLMLHLHLVHMNAKAICPEFFCWPDRYMHNKDATQESLQLAEAYLHIYKLNQAPFYWACREDGRILTNPNTFPGNETSPARVALLRDDTASHYFSTKAAHDVVRQLVARRGAFALKFLWNDEPDYAEFIRGLTEPVLGVPLHEVTVL